MGGMRQATPLCGNRSGTTLLVLCVNLAGLEFGIGGSVWPAQNA